MQQKYSLTERDEKAPGLDQWREAFAEERRQGASEAEIVEAVNVIVAGIERQRGMIDDQVIDEMILMVKECAYATHETPGRQ